MNLKRVTWKHLSEISCERPGRYTGGEVNSISPDADAEFRICLVFPDLYDLGISYYGFQILYHLFNQIPGVSCERAYLPWRDMQEGMAKSGIPLYSLEGGRLLKDFDAIGITLQTELHYPGVVKVLDLAGIPRQSKNRKPNDPIILGGGPCAFHPEPIAPFFDALLVGDGEEAVFDISKVCADRDFKRAPRQEKWQALSQIRGMYVPELYRPDRDDAQKIVPIADAPAKIHARITEKLDRSIYPDKPLVPIVPATHDRLTIEVMRGCSQGCRFCQAGMIHRPVRERDPNEIVEQVMSGLNATGWNEVGLLSLSTSDYSHLKELLERLNERLPERRASVSFPSLRPGSFTEEMAALNTGGRKHSLTFAIEAGSERLRSSINKSLRSEELYEAIERSLKHGWKGLKLYFMVGLPTETYADLDEGAEMLRKIQGMLRRNNSLNISVSPFIPKPFSVFEGEAFGDTKDLLKRQYCLIKNLRGKGIKTSYRDPDESMIEAVLSRGDRNLASVIEIIASEGSGFEAWGGEFSFHRWTEALNKLIPDWTVSLERKGLGDSTSWGHISKGISRKFIRTELERSQNNLRTADCRLDECTNCGLMTYCEKITADSVPQIEKNRNEEPAQTESSVTVVPQTEKFRYRLEFAKLRRARYLGHHDLMRTVNRMLIRAGVPLAFTQGFNPRPVYSYAPALSLGVGATKTWIDMQVTTELDQTQWLDLIHLQAPMGIRPLRLYPIEKGSSADKSAEEVVRNYRVKVKTAQRLTSLDDTAEQPMWLDSFFISESKRHIYIRVIRDGGRFPKMTELVSWVSGKLNSDLDWGDAHGVESVTLID